ncbi:MAG: DUF1566 domain-containing protein [Geobacter sp.]|nr:DUF1566 domain-containing protein [Geobacter sp.]
MKRLLPAVFCLLFLITFTANASTIQLPQSGQITVYSATDDGDIKAGIRWPNPRFSDTGSDMVIDNLTGLTWTKDANLIKNRNPGFDADGVGGDGAVSWQHALDYIHKLNQDKYLGYNDWRLPNLNELGSLVNHGQTGASIWLNGQGFINVQPLPYWTSSTNVVSTGTAWMVGMDGGPLQYIGKSGVGSVWPVRGGQSGTAASSGINLSKTGQTACFDSNGTTIPCAGTGQDGELQIGAAWPQPRFSDNDDQTVTDNLTGLIWTRDANLMLTRNPEFDVDGIHADGAVIWQSALDYVNKLNQEAYLGFSDWRLPNRIELASVMNYVEVNPFYWLNWQGIFNVRNNYWTSATVASVTDNAWNVNTSGDILGESKLNNSGSFVWPVRGAAIIPLSLPTNTIHAKNVSSPVTTQSVALAAATALSITTATLPSGTIGTVYSQTLAATGGTTPYTWTKTTGSLPTGLTLSTAGVISGTPTTAATSSFTVQVKDKSAKTATKSLSITVNAGVLAISTTALADGYLTTAYSQTLSASGGKTAYTWSITAGTLPAGLTLAASTGVISGTPSATGTSSITVQVKDSNNAIATKALTVTVYALPAITTPSLPAGTIGVAYSQTLTATGGKTPNTWAVSSGTLPAGLTLNATSGVISGTPTTAVTSSVTFKVTDANAKTATKALSITINAAPLSITTASLADGYLITTYSQTIVATGGKTAYTWSITSGMLPAGLTLSASTGVISGTPTATGTSSITVQVKEASNTTATKALTIAVYALPVISTTSLPAGSVGAVYNQTLTATGGKSTLTWSVSSGTLPAGLSLNTTTGNITGSPTAIATSSVTFKVTDANTKNATKALSITINAAPPSINTKTLADGYPGVSYSQSLSASGGKTPYNWTVPVGSLPSGLILSSTGVISGTPVSAGSSSFTVQVKDTNNVTSSALLNITIRSPFSVTDFTPPLNSVDVLTNTVTASFSELPNPATITSGSFAVSRKVKVTQVVSGDSHTVALKSDGTVVAWGDNSYGQTAVPTGLSDVKAVAAGTWHTVALKYDGTVAAWGDDGYAQAMVPAELSGVIAVSSGGHHVVALKNDGTVVTWGTYSYPGGGQLQIPTPSGLSNVIAVSSSEYHTVALKGDGTVVA